MNGITLADSVRSGSAIEQSLGETRTGQSRLAYRLAAALLIVGVASQIVDALLTPNTPGGLNISIVIDLGLAIGLLQLRAGARTWVLIRAGLGAIVWPVLFFQSNDFASAVLMTLAEWGYCGGLILLLTGQSKTWRLVLAVAVFAVFFLGLVALSLLLLALGALLQI